MRSDIGGPLVTQRRTDWATKFRLAHLTLGEGTMDWQAMLSTLLDGGYTGWLDIDLWEHPDPFAGAEAGKQALDGLLAQRCEPQ